jgi:hypothetical protein
MPFDLEITVPRAQIERLADHFPDAVQAGLRRVAEHVHGVAVRKAGEIYNEPIPTRAQVAAYKRTGKRPSRKRIGGANPAWERKGDLPGGLLQAVKSEPVFAADAVTLTADVAHARPRHELGVTRQPKAPALGIVRRNPFFAETVEIVEPQIEELFEDGVREELGL